MNLQKKAILIVAGILFFIIGINTAVLTIVAFNKYKLAILSKTTAIGESMQRELSKVLNLGVPLESFEGLNEKLAELISRDNTIGYAMVVNTTGNILFHNDKNSIGNELKDKASLEAVSSDKMLIQKTDSFYDLSFPLLNAEDKRVGTLRIGLKLKVINTQLYELLSWALKISLLCFLLSLVLVYFSISKFIIQPIMTMERVADRIASGDLTYVIEVKSQDEIASLGNAINTMTVNLKDVISKIGNISNSVANVTSNIASSSKNLLEIADVQKKAVEETASAIEEMSNSISTVSMSAESLSKSASDTSSSIFQMTTSMDTIVENTNKFSDTTESTTSSIEEMVINIKEIAESVEKLSATSSEIASSIEEVNDTTKNIAQSANESVILAERVMANASDKGINAANAAMEGMEIIKNSVVTLSEVITTLGKRSNEIGKILNVIDSVAEQTNLLALNAAILAAKAGEHGRGFAVVANEIKDLAERTSKSTTEIASLIKSVQDETKFSVRMASEGVQTVQSGITLVKGVNDALREILDSSKVSTEMARAIQKATAEETVIIKHITNAVEAVTHQIENISRATKEQSKGSNFIIETTAKMNEISYQLKTSLGEQRDGSRQIASATENVTNEASHIAASTGRQKEKSMDVVHSMERIRNTTGNLTTSSNEMYEAINSLKEGTLNLIGEVKKFKV